MVWSGYRNREVCERYALSEDERLLKAQECRVTPGETANNMVSKGYCNREVGKRCILSENLSLYGGKD